MLNYLRNIFTRKRYFYVYYTAVVNQMHRVEGYSSVTTGGEMFNLKMYVDTMMDEKKYQSIVVNNFIELSKKDYESLFN